MNGQKYFGPLQGVAVHCMNGQGTTGTMLACKE